MRARKTGTIVNVSSIGGLDCLATSGVYGASKFALEGTLRIPGTRGRRIQHPRPDRRARGFPDQVPQRRLSMQPHPASEPYKGTIVDQGEPSLQGRWRASRRETQRRV